jgi:hypothetical protein
MPRAEARLVNHVDGSLHPSRWNGQASGSSRAKPSLSRSRPRRLICRLVQGMSLNATAILVLRAEEPHAAVVMSWTDRRGRE